MRLTILTVSLLLTLLLTYCTTKTPSPRPLDAAEVHFSAARAMEDVRQIARAPHPLGSEEHVRVRQYLSQRLTDLGFSVEEQSGYLTLRAVQRLQAAGGTPEAANFSAVNLIAVRKGTDSSLPPIMLMSHYDTVVGSPGAADASSGIAAILETARALQARNSQKRDLVIVFTDAEELGLQGANIFFEEHPLAKEVGFILNLEARGGGGRAAMFETGIGDGPTIKAFTPIAMKADGGVSATSLAVFMYERMPNSTDFTLARTRGIMGMNFAFIGRPSQYHASDATPENLDQGALQHIGSQTLETTARLMKAEVLPATGDNRVYSDIFGKVVISHSKTTGWILLALSLAGLGVVVWRGRRHANLSLKQIVQGVLDGIWFLCGGFILLQGLRFLAGPVGDRITDSGTYYVLLRRLPWMEAGAALALLALMLVLLSGARAHHRRVFGYGFAAITVVLVLMLSAKPIWLVPGAIAAVLSLWPGAASRSIWGAWSGLLILVFIAGCGLQAYAPEAALLLVWPLVLGTLAAVITSFVSPSANQVKGLIAPAIASILGGAWLMGLGHFIYLGIGISLAGVLVVIGLLMMLFLRPLVPARSDHILTGAALVFLLLAGGLTAGSQIIEPAAKTQTNLP